MKSHDQLTSLIFSMSSMEKQYFRKYAMAHPLAGGNRYLPLFEDLAAGRIPKTKASASSRNYLQSVILRALRNFHEHSSSEMEMRAMLDHIEVLHAKRQLKLATLFVDRGLNLARDLGEPLMILAFGKWQRRLLRSDTEIPTPSALAELDSRDDDAMNDLTLEIKAIQLHDANFAALRKAGSPVQPQSLLLHEPASFDGSIALQTCKGMIAKHHGDDAASLRHFQANVEIWYRFPRRIQDHPRRFTAALGNFLGACHKLNRFEEFDKVMQRIRALPFQDSAVLTEAELQCLKLLFVLHMNQFNFQGADAALVQLLALRDAKEEALVLDAGLQFTIAVYHFVAGHKRDAIKLLGELIQGRRSDANAERRDAARLLELLLFIDLEEDEVVTTRLRSLLRIQGKLALQPWALLFLRQLPSILKIHPHPRRQAAYGELQAQMSSYAGNKGVAFEEVLLWLKAKAVGAQLRQFLDSQATPFFKTE